MKRLDSRSSPEHHAVQGKSGMTVCVKVLLNLKALLNLDVTVCAEAVAAREGGNFFSKQKRSNELSYPKRGRNVVLVMKSVRE